MAREIPLGRTGNLVAIVDDEDFDSLSQYKWRAMRARKRNHPDEFRAVRGTHGSGEGIVFMHRQITDAPKGIDVDHANGDTLDNRRANLRHCNQSQNQANRHALEPLKTSRFKGVCWNGSRWQAGIKVQGKSIHLGVYRDEKDAAAAYDEAARKHFGEFAHTNEEAA